MASVLSGLICKERSKAAREYSRRAIGIMICYMGAVWQVTALVRSHHFTGPKLWAVSLLPAIPIIALLAVVGLYLRDEQDEFKRWLVVQAIVWAVGITLAVSTVSDFLRSYGAMSAPPPFTEFIVFWLSMAGAQVVLKLRNRADSDE